MDWIRITYLTLLLLFGSGLLHAQPLNEAYFFTDSNNIINYGVEAMGDNFVIGGHTQLLDSSQYIFPAVQKLSAQQGLYYLNQQNVEDTAVHYGMVNGSLSLSYDNEIIITGGYGSGASIVKGAFISVYDSIGNHKFLKQFPQDANDAGSNFRRAYKVDSSTYIGIGIALNLADDHELIIVKYDLQQDIFIKTRIYIDSFQSLRVLSGSYQDGVVTVAAKLNAGAGTDLGALCIVDYNIYTHTYEVNKYSTVQYNIVEDSYVDAVGNVFSCGLIVNEHQGVIYWEGVISKIDSNRDLKWVKRMGDVHGGTVLTSIYPYDENSYIVAGYTTDSTDLTSYGFYYAGWLIKFTDLGDSMLVDWERKYTYFPIQEDYRLHYLFDVAVNDKKEICAVGWAGRNNVNVGQRGWVIKTDSNGCLIDSCWLQSSMVEPQTPAAEAFVLLYPNPSQDHLYLQYRFPPNSGELNWSIYDVKGSKLLEGQLRGQQGMQNIDVQQLERGTYFLKVIGTEVLEEQSFVKQ